jgi:hypothetical protein
MWWKEIKWWCDELCDDVMNYVMGGMNVKMWREYVMKR